MKHIAAALMTAVVVATSVARPTAQSLADARKQFDAGEYQRAVDAASGSSDPRATYLVAQSQQRLRRGDEARRAYEQLAARPEGDPWHDIGLSGLALLTSNTGDAVRAGDRAAASGASLAEAQYQRGLALASAQNMADAAAAFDKAATLDPSWAYAHYYAGIAYSKLKRSDLTASHFQTFLKLAPQAPERGEVQAILRTLGR